ncbi:MAG: ABC transporter permease [Bacteroidetes bacterium]|nr:ABC transporter permease [Bacteroidota bacterium]
MNRQQTIGQKLFHKSTAVVALTVIFFTVVIAVFAYVIAPDNTPFANNMAIELAAKQPGFSTHFLLVPKMVKQSEPPAWQAFWSGKPTNFVSVPINGYFVKGNQLVVRHYVDDGLEDTLHYSLSSLQSSPNYSLNDVIKNQIKTQTFWLGTDRYGRDILSRLIVGTRVSISVGLVAVLLSLSIGIFLGSIAGYYGGWVDDLVMWVINILWSIPTLLLVFAITLTIGKGFWEIFIAIGLTMWVGAARLIRGQVKVLKEMEYITAARALGLSDMRIIFRHILPNIVGPVMVIAASNFATAILIEAGLSFLGIGVQPPQPSWGLMIKEHYNFLLANRPILAIIPGIAIMLLVYAFNVLGNALRDVLDVRD